MSSKKNPVAIAEEFASKMKEAFGNELQSLFLVGSAVRGDFKSGKSDVNTLVILTSEGMDWLEKTYPILKTMRKKGLAVPHFMMPDAVTRALDSYPLEFLDFKTFHKVIVGPDILANISIPHQPLRLQIEREMRGKLFLLRQLFASEAGKNKQLQSTLKLTVSVLTAVFQGILELEGKPIPSNRPELFREAASITGSSDKVFQRILEVREGRGEKNYRVVFKELLGEIGGIVSWADKYVITD